MSERSITLFGFGFTARAIARRLSEDGWHVRATTRSTGQVEAIAALGYEAKKKEIEAPTTELLSDSRGMFSKMCRVRFS